MQLKAPFKISARLMAALEIGKPNFKGHAWISLGIGKRTDDGRIEYEVYIDIGKKAYKVKDLRSGVTRFAGPAKIQEGFVSLLSFLGAAAESYRSRMGKGQPDAEEESSFHPKVVEWAYQNSEEISSLEYEIEETKDLITD